MKTRTMTRTQAELLLAAVIIARSTSYVLTKVGLQDMGKFTLLAVRFLLAFAFLAVLFRRLLQIDRRTLLSGLAMGGIYFCVMTAELTALKTVETSTVSFVTNTAVVIVLLIQAALSRRWPERRVLFGALACLLGVALLAGFMGLCLKGGKAEMEMVIWIAAMVVFGVVEAVTVGLVSIWFVLGSAAGLIAAICEAPIWLQVVLFFAVSIAALIATRPLVRKMMDKNIVPTNADAVLGREARVTEAIDNTVPSGAVYVDGKTWSARSESGETLPEGTLVRAVRMEGVKLFVERLQ